MEAKITALRNKNILELQAEFESLFDGQKASSDNKIHLIRKIAYRIQGLISGGKAEGLKQISGWLNMNHQRLNQIMNLLLLAPKIQEEIICTKNETISHVPEYKLRDVAFELSWPKQLEMWQKLLEK